MHGFAFFNHEITPASKISLPAVSSATFYGRGIFSTLAIYNSKPFQWEKHWQRLIENAQAIGIDLLEFTKEKVRNSLSEIIQRNNLRTGRARITFFDESAKGVWKIQNNRRTSLLITTADFRKIPNSLRLTVSPYPINSKSPLINIKSCNYLENLLVLENAAKTGFDEVVRLNERNEVVSAAMANIFWTVDGEIFTSAAETGALSGTTRDFVLKNFPVCEKYATLDELKNAHEIFLSSAGVGLVGAKSLENKIFGHSDVFIKIKNLFNEFINEM
jgi:4-amino-4-deoxychorismate lyase